LPSSVSHVPAGSAANAGTSVAPSTAAAIIGERRSLIDLPLDGLQRERQADACGKIATTNGRGDIGVRLFTACLSPHRPSVRMVIMCPIGGLPIADARLKSGNIAAFSAPQPNLADDARRRYSDSIHCDP
jgi:hypothetical protein